MSEIEDLIESMPLTIEKKIEHCCECGNKYYKKHKYYLKIKVLEYYTYDKPAHRYLAYYKCQDFGLGERKRYIGRACGFGESTLKKALEELKNEVLND